MRASNEVLRLFILTFPLLLFCGCSGRDIGPNLSHNSAIHIVRVKEQNESSLFIAPNGKVTAKARSIVDVLRNLCPEPHYLKADTELPQGFYDITISPPNSNEKESYQLLKSEFERIFGLKVLIRDLDVNVFALVCTASNPPPLEIKLSPDQRGLAGQNGKHFHNYTMQEFVAHIEKLTDVPVVNKTGLQGQFDFDFGLIDLLSHPAQLKEKLARISLGFKEEKATLRFMIISKEVP